MHGQLPGFPRAGEVTRYRVAPEGNLRATVEAAEEPGPREVWIEVHGAELGRHELGAIDRGPAGATPGSSCAGVVVCAGDLAGELVGETVLLPSLLPCGECNVCRRGWATACPSARRPGIDVDGAFASHVRAPATFLTRLSGELALPEGAERAALALIAGPAARAHQAMSRVGVGPNELAIWVGFTLETAFGLELTRARGAFALVVEPDPTRAARARALRADEIVADASDREAVTAAATRLEAALPWRVFEMTGRPEAAGAAARLASAGGSITLVSPSGDAPLPLEWLARNDIAVHASRDPHPDLLPELVALTLRDDLVGHREARQVGPQELEAALGALRQGSLEPAVFCPLR